MTEVHERAQEHIPTSAPDAPDDDGRVAGAATLQGHDEPRQPVDDRTGVEEAPSPSEQAGESIPDQAAVPEAPDRQLGPAGPPLPRLVASVFTSAAFVFVLAVFLWLALAGRSESAGSGEASGREQPAQRAPGIVPTATAGAQAGGPPPEATPDRDFMPSADTGIELALPYSTPQGPFDLSTPAPARTATVLPAGAASPAPRPSQTPTAARGTSVPTRTPTPRSQGDLPATIGPQSARTSVPATPARQDPTSTPTRAPTSPLGTAISTPRVVPNPTGGTPSAAGTPSAFSPIQVGTPPPAQR